MKKPHCLVCMYIHICIHSFISTSLSPHYGHLNQLSEQNTDGRRLCVGALQAQPGGLPRARVVGEPEEWEAACGPSRADTSSEYVM